MKEYPALPIYFKIRRGNKTERWFYFDTLNGKRYFAKKEHIDYVCSKCDRFEQEDYLITAPCVDKTCMLFKEFPNSLMTEEDFYNLEEKKHIKILICKGE